MRLRNKTKTPLSSTRENKVEKSNTGEPVSCKDFCRRYRDTFPPGANKCTLKFFPALGPGPGADGPGGLAFAEMRRASLHFLGSRVHGPPAPLPASKMVGKLSFRRAEEPLWCYVLAVPVVVL
jgi:hypothetical protein